MAGPNLERFLARAPEELTVAELPPASGPRREFIVTDALAPDITQPVIGGGRVEVAVRNLNGAWFPTSAPPDLTGQPPFPPAGVRLAEPLTFFGHSFIAKQTDRVCMTELLKNRFVFGTVDNEGISGQTTTQIANRVDDTDPTIVDPDAGLTRAQQVAGRVVLDMGLNSFTRTVGSVIMPTVFADRDRAIAQLTGPFLLLTDPTSRSYPIGSPVWAQAETSKRRNMADWPDRAVDWTWTLAQYSDGGVQDEVDLFNGTTPSSCRTYDDGSVNDLHPGTKGNKAMAYGPVWSWLRHVEQGTVWMPPFHDAWISGAAADTAIAADGHVYNVPYQGSGGVFAHASGHTDKFSVNVATGEVKCRAAFTPAQAYYDLVVRLTKGAVTVEQALRLWIGKNTRGCDDRPVSRDTGGAIAFADAASGIVSKALSIVVGVAAGAGTDGRKMYLRGAENASIELYRDTDNKVKMVARNTGGTVIASLVSNTTLNVASGMTWVAVSVDLNPVTPVARMYFNGTSVLASSPTLTQGQTIDWNKRAVLLGDGALTYPWNGTLRDYWEATSYIDWSTSARRDERFDAGTLAAVVLPSGGAINGITPIWWTPGNLADLYWGRSGTGQNAGSGPAGVGCARHYPNPGAGGQQDGNFTPLDLGAKLTNWWSADDHGTANMTVETGERVTEWKCRISGMSMTAATGSTARPTWTERYDGNDWPAVTFNGANVLAATVFAGLTTGATSSRLFLSAVNLVGGAHLFTYGTNGSNTLRRITVDANLRASAGDGNVQALAPSGVTWNGHRVVDARYSTAGHALNIDGTQVATSTANASMNTGTSIARMGASAAPTASSYTTGGIRHVISTTDTLTEAEWQKLQGWLMWDVGRQGELPATHPYRDYRP